MRDTSCTPGSRSPAFAASFQAVPAAFLCQSYTRPTKGEMSCTPASRTGQCLAEREEQRQVAVDALVLERLGRLDAFPGRRHLDEHAITVDAGPLVKRDQMVRACDRGAGVEAGAGVHLRRDPPGNDLEDLEPEAHDHLVDELRQRQAAVRSDDLVEQRRIGRLLHGLQDQRGVGGGVPGRELRQFPEVAGVCNHGGALLQLLELVHRV